MLYTTIESPIGELLLVGDGYSLHRLSMQDGRHPTAINPGWERRGEPFGDVGDQLSEYFDGARRAFDVPLELTGNQFELRVWQALCEIPYGETFSYGQLAATVGQPTAARAVGLANARNPIALIVPCHRVIGADGTLTGYGGGLERKRFLLDLEAGVLPLVATGTGAGPISEPRASPTPPIHSESSSRTGRALSRARVTSSLGP
jgi:methylated-DNA-[protein]-cysteine S-methyltransferase